jgi:type I restriction enzyme, S subunit
MKPDWEVKALGDVSAIGYGYTESASDEPVGPKFLRITDIQDDQVSWDDVPYCKIETSNLPRFRLASGDIVFARTGATTGKSYLVTNPPEAVFASYLIRLRLRHSMLLPEFVSYFFQTAAYWRSIKEGSSGSAQGGFNATKLGALSIPIPPVSEQRRIVGILDEACDGISSAKVNAVKNCRNARAIFASHLRTTFMQTADMVQLCDLATDITDGDHMPPPKAEEGVPFITISNIVKRTREIDFSDTFRVPDAYFRNLKRNKKPNVGDILYTVTGSYGIPVLVKESRDFCFQRHIALIRPRPETDSSWLTYALLSPQVFEQATARSTGTAQKTVSLNVLRGFMVPKVNTVEQRRVAHRLDELATATQRLETIYQRRIAVLDELKGSLLHRAFNGEI